MCDASMGHVRRIRGPQAVGSTSHVRRLHGPCATAPWATGGWQAAVRHDTVVSRRRRRHATAASSDFFCVPFGGGGASGSVCRQCRKRRLLGSTFIGHCQRYARRLAVSVPPRRESLTHLTDTCSITQTTTSHLAYAPPPQPPPPPLLPPPRCCRVGAVTAAPYTAPSRAVASTCTATPLHHSRPPCCRRPDRTITGR